MIFYGVGKHRGRVSLAGLLICGMLAGCGERDRDMEELVSKEPVVSASVSEESVSSEFDFEELQQELLAWYETLTEEDFAAAKTVEELTTDDFLIRQLVLLGDLPEARVKIYGELSDGCLLILEHQGQRHAFVKDFLTPRAVLPEFCVYDYDGDRTVEVGMICYVFSGTGVAIRDFSVFDSVEEDFDTLYTMPEEEELRACDQVWWSYEEHVLRIGVADEYEEHSLKDTPFAGMGIKGLALGNITEFSFGESGEVYCDVRLALALEEQVTPFLLEEMGTLYDGAVLWNINNVCFQVHYDGAGVFRTDGISLR